MSPPSLFLELSDREGENGPISQIALLAVVGRERGNVLSFPSGFFSCRYGTKRSRKVCFLSWSFIHRYRTKRGSQGVTGGSLCISVHLMLWDFLSDCCVAGPIDMRDVLAAVVWARWDLHKIFRRRRKSKHLFQRHCCDDVSRGFEKGKRGGVGVSSQISNSPSLLESINYLKLAKRSIDYKQKHMTMKLQRAHEYETTNIYIFIA